MNSSTAVIPLSYVQCMSPTFQITVIGFVHLEGEQSRIGMDKLAQAYLPKGESPKFLGG